MPVQDTAGAEAAVAAAPESRAERRLLIDGRLVATGDVSPSINPATGEVIGHAPDAGVGEAGATPVAGATRWDPGRFCAAALLTNVDPDSEIAQEEVLGPVFVVIGFDDDAVRVDNNSIHGSAGAVFSRDPERAHAVARRIRAGSLSLDGGNYVYVVADSPFGGFTQSGIGREMGVAGLEEFLERKTPAIPAEPAEPVVGASA